MRLTPKQRKELKVLEYFIPGNYTHSPINDEDIERYFAWSDRGVGKDKVEREAMQTNTGLSALYWAKNRRDLQITSYLEDWGTTCNVQDFTDEPREVVEYISKAMSKPAILAHWKVANKSQDLTVQEVAILNRMAGPFLSYQLMGSGKSVFMRPLDEDGSYTMG